MLCDPDPGLYDPKAPDHIYFQEYRTSYICKHILWDFSYYKNRHSDKPRYYIYFGPSVALVFYCPTKLLFNFYYGARPLIFLIFSLTVLAFAGILRTVVCYWFEKTPLFVQGISIVAYGCCNFMLSFMYEVSHYQLAIASGILFSISCIYFLVRSLTCSPNYRLMWLLFAGTATGLAMTSRLNDIFMAFPLVMVWVYFTFGPSFKSGSWKQGIRFAVFLFTAPLLMGLGYLWYNYVRFDNPFEPGIHYQLNALNNLTDTHFSFRYMLDGLWGYFCTPYQVVNRFPYIDYWNYTPSWISVDAIAHDNRAGLLISSPICILALFWWYYVAQISDITKRSGAFWFGIIVSVYAVLSILMMTSYYAQCMRYEAEIPTPLLLLSALTVAARFHISGPFRWWESLFLAIATLYSCFMGLVYTWIGPYHWSWS